MNGLQVDCVIGERPEERLRPQRLLIDIELEVETRAGESDRLEDAVDYAVLADRVRELLIAAKCQLIERAAQRVAELCREDARVKVARVAVTKTGAIPGLVSATAVATL